MPSRKIKSVLENFLGTFTSRNSDYHGFWLLGLVENELKNCNINLLASTTTTTSQTALKEVAVQRFRDQVAKARLPVAAVSAAELQMSMKPETVQDFVGSSVADGHMVMFKASATMNNGKRYETERLVFIAPHDPSRERSRTPEKWGPKESSTSCC